VYRKSTPARCRHAKSCASPFGPLVAACAAAVAASHTSSRKQKSLPSDAIMYWPGKGTSEVAGADFKQNRRDIITINSMMKTEEELNFSTSTMTLVTRNVHSLSGCLKKTSQNEKKMHIERKNKGRGEAG
jgi:hypothetical protein